jgi:hypothetical protein
MYVGSGFHCLHSFSFLLVRSVMSVGVVIGSWHRCGGMVLCLRAVWGVGYVVVCCDSWAKHWRLEAMFVLMVLVRRDRVTWSLEYYSPH